MSRNKVIIGVDLGTTYSGIGWLHAGMEASELEILSEYPGQNRTQEKVPTEVLYDGAPPDEPLWGWQAKGNPKSQKYFKLALDPSQRDRIRTLFDVELALGSQTVDSAPSSTTDSTDSTAQERIFDISEGHIITKSPEDACTDFLRSIRTEAMGIIEERPFYNSALGPPELEYVMTVPAIWSERAKDMTKRCAIKAGFGTTTSDIKLIAEPEAAAAYALRQMTDTYIPRIDDNFVLCDAGGGTVDLITYRVVSTNPLELEESVPGTGEPCGSMCLNWRFEAYLAEKLGVDYTKKGSDGQERAKQAMSKLFEEGIKPDFEDDAATSWPIRLPQGVEDDPERGIEDGELIATNEEISTIFKPVVGQILELINEQIATLYSSDESSRVAAILLVGGFGGSSYLKKRVEEAFQNGSSTGLKVLRPVNAWSAVVRGAILWGADERAIVTKRKARRSFGIEVYGKWVEGSPEKKWHEYDKVWKCHKMRWDIHAGDDLSKEIKTKIKVHTTFPTSDNPPILEVPLFAYTPPEPRRKEPRFRNSGCEKVGKLVVDLTLLPKDRLTIIRPRRLEHLYRVNFELVLEFQTDFTFSFFFDGVTWGTATIKYED